jgi:hypothetical protein
MSNELVPGTRAKKPENREGAKNAKKIIRE